MTCPEFGAALVTFTIVSKPERAKRRLRRQGRAGAQPALRVFEEWYERREGFLHRSFVRGCMSRGGRETKCALYVAIIVATCLGFDLA